MKRPVCPRFLPGLAICCGALYAAEPVSFERDIQPVFAKCAPCHNDTTHSSGLSLASRNGLLAGGNRGPAISLEHPADSLLLNAVRQTGPLKMPPGGHLSAEEIGKIEAWITAGAAYPETAGSHVASTHWAFQPIRRVAAPAVRDSKWPRTDIDSFVLARLEKEKIVPSPEADPRTLVRRVFLDLIGLPPGPAELDEYLADKRADRYERLVDRLLASEHYGEMWGRHWLDQARYADSDGGSRDEPREIWMYRDWVIKALNRDMPFDEFVTEQIAGDLLPRATPEQITATAFNRNSPLQIEAGTDREEFRVEAVSDRVDTFGNVFLGLTVGCARCHDHKYDPIRQREYYQLFSFFNNVEEYGPEIPAFSDTGDIQATHAPLLPIGPPDEVAQWQALRAQLLALYRERFAYRGGEAGLHKGDPADKARTETITELKRRLPNLPLVMVMEERAQPRDAYILLVGDYQRRGAKVTPGVIASLNPLPPRADGKPFTRLDLAHWVVDPKNPLTARVAVNRIWQQYFGAGLVDTENDFGTRGSAPSHAELLDWLAREFMARGWSRKAIHRLIVTSAVYRQSSKVRPELARRDPSNRLLARQARLRLDAEIIRDSGLVVSGLLNAKVGGPSVFPPQPAGVMDTGQVKQAWKTSAGADRYRRGLYTFQYRLAQNPAMKLFDEANGTTPCTRRARTDTPLQALTLLNDPNFHEMAQAFAKRVFENTGDPLDYAFSLALGRQPTAAERGVLMRFHAVELDSFQTQPADAVQMAGEGASPEFAAWVSVCRALLNLDEFINRE